MRAALVAVLFCAVATGQAIVDADRIGTAVKLLDEPTDRVPLNCSVYPLSPRLNFALRFQAGYVFSVPLKQYIGTGHELTLVTRITPRDGDAKPVYLLNVMHLPPIPSNKADGQAGGSYLLGEGHYDVAWMLMDDAGRTCRKSWHVDASLSRGEKQFKMAMPSGSVASLSLPGRPMRGSTVVEREADGPPLRLTVLMDAAPVSFRRFSRTAIDPNDSALLLGMLSALLEKLPNASVRLILFNLEQQQELVRRDGFSLGELNQVSQALNNLSLGTIDAHTLANPGGRLGMLSGFINAEMRRDPSADAVVFLGPRERYDEKPPADILDKPGANAPHFFYLQYRPQGRPALPTHVKGDPSYPTRVSPMPGRSGPTLPSAPDPYGPDFPDSISRLLDRVKGDTIRIHNPSEFAKAIARLEHRTRPSADGKTK
jgi:hypothetical protein